MTDDKDKITIIVPVYNVALFLPKCLDSILNQTYKNLEVILVDDGSTDESGKICDEYAKKDNRIVVIHKENEGVSIARNCGIKNAAGKYICFVDGDDWVNKDYVSYLHSLVIHNDAPIACTSKVITPYNKKTKQINKIETISGEDATERILYYKLPIGVYSKIFKLDFVKEHNIVFSQNLVIGEGFNFNTHAFQCAEKVNIGRKMIYHYRKNNQSSVTTRYDNKKWKNGILALEMIRDNLLIKTKRIMRAWNYAYWRTKTDVYDLIMIHQVKNQFPETYKIVTKNMRLGGVLAICCPISNKDRLRAALILISPGIIPKLMIIRKKIFHQNQEKA